MSSHPPAWAAATAASQQRRWQATLVATAVAVAWMSVVWSMVAASAPTSCGDPDALSRAATSSADEARVASVVPLGAPSATAGPSLGDGWIPTDLEVVATPEQASENWREPGDALDEYERHGFVQESRQAWQQVDSGDVAHVTRLYLETPADAQGYQAEAITEACGVLREPTTDRPRRVLVADDSGLEQGGSHEWRVMAVVGDVAVRMDVVHGGDISRAEVEQMAALVVLPPDPAAAP